VHSTSPSRSISSSNARTVVTLTPTAAASCARVAAPFSRSTLCNAELLAYFSRPGLAWEFSTSGTSFVILFYKFVVKV
jgi:hypothetical protein